VPRKRIVSLRFDWLEDGFCSLDQKISLGGLFFVAHVFRF